MGVDLEDPDVALLQEDLRLHLALGQLAAHPVEDLPEEDSLLGVLGPLVEHVGQGLQGGEGQLEGHPVEGQGAAVSFQKSWRFFPSSMIFYNRQIPFPTNLQVTCLRLHSLLGHRTLHKTLFYDTVKFHNCTALKSHHDILTRCSLEKHRSCHVPPVRVAWRRLLEKVLQDEDELGEPLDGLHKLGEEPETVDVGHLLKLQQTTDDSDNKFYQIQLNSILYFISHRAIQSILIFKLSIYLYH